MDPAVAAKNEARYTNIDCSQLRHGVQCLELYLASMKRGGVGGQLIRYEPTTTAARAPARTPARTPSVVRAQRRVIGQTSVECFQLSYGYLQPISTYVSSVSTYLVLHTKGPNRRWVAGRWRDRCPGQIPLCWHAYRREHPPRPMPWAMRWDVRGTRLDNTSCG